MYFYSRSPSNRYCLWNQPCDFQVSEITAAKEEKQGLKSWSPRQYLMQQRSLSSRKSFAIIQATFAEQILFTFRRSRAAVKMSFLYGTQSREAYSKRAIGYRSLPSGNNYGLDSSNEIYKLKARGKWNWPTGWAVRLDIGKYERLRNSRSW